MAPGSASTCPKSGLIVKSTATSFVSPTRPSTPTLARRFCAPAYGSPAARVSPVRTCPSTYGCTSSGLRGVMPSSPFSVPKRLTQPGCVCFTEAQLLASWWRNRLRFTCKPHSCEASFPKRSWLNGMRASTVYPRLSWRALLNQNGFQEESQFSPSSLMNSSPRTPLAEVEKLKPVRRSLKLSKLISTQSPGNSSLRPKRASILLGSLSKARHATYRKRASYMILKRVSSVTGATSLGCRWWKSDSLQGTCSQAASSRLPSTVGASPAMRCVV